MFETFFAGWRHRLPVFIQTEATECGLCSLAMVANYHGYRTDLANLRLRFSISRKGATLEALMRIAEAMRLQTRALRLEMEHLPQLQLPCVLHWDMNHFVVLKSVDARHAVIHDPAVGERRLGLAEFGKHFTGVALEVSPSPEFVGQAPTPKLSLRGLMGRVTGLRRGLAQIALLAVLLELIAMALPFYLQWVVDHVLVTADADMLMVLAAGFGLLVIVHAVISATRGWFVVVLSTSLNFQWLGNVFAHLVRLPLDFFEKRHIGHILASFGSVVMIQRTLTTQFAQTVVDGLMTLGTLTMMLFYSPSLTLVSVLAMLIYALLRWGVFRALREASAEQIIHAARQQTHMIETASGIQSVRLFGKGDVRRAGWLNMLADQFNAELRIQRLTLSQDTARGLLSGLERVIVVWLAARLVLSHEFTAGMLFAFMAYQLQFSTRVSALVDKLAELSMLRLHGERVADIVLQQTERDAQDLPAEVDLSKLSMSVELRNVSFRYSPTEPFVLHGVDLRIEPGECVAITGPSGCGKTTLVKVMLGLLQPTEGEIVVGGMRLGQLGLANYRRLIGTVMQEDRLFSGSIADNICFFDPDPQWERIVESARQAGVEREITEMPMGFHTLTGESGIGLSGGQKQRILLARALYHQPRMLVLDEATSHLDLGNERSVNATVQALALTRVIVAHRPETIAMAERVVVLAAGRLRPAGDAPAN
ncbi:MAG TPA: peptidase domain-containing ABC transporter [Ideonella sp.]|uniref:peptidase domain-containing ABC transporter n=1 Tax=Ideonella sp. TaxID=1929293 RepID=UPI002E37C41C|nr:peptidase domain-containing ABC transporter [Ideonella sp.]HEX5683622.1 peptidase domain-containing ABC transporter [Ideonella sp.]